LWTVTTVESTAASSKPPGPLALVGSGEYTATMLDLERSLIDGRPPRYVQIPTAASKEGPRRLSYWVDLGKAQAARLGVEAVPLMVSERAQADDPAVAAQVRGAGLIYLSGGSPAVLADTLRDTAVWRAIVAAWRSGAALAGCSAGAMALADQVPDLRNPTGCSRPGLGLLPHLRVLPHFDKMLGWVPDVLTRPFFRTTGGISLVGIDEDTALVGGPEDFTVYGRQSAWLLSDGRRQQFPAGSRVRLPWSTQEAGSTMVECG
jgi:cyanophycinase